MSRIRLTIAALFPLFTFACDAELDADEASLDGLAADSLLELPLADDDEPVRPPTGPRGLKNAGRPDDAGTPTAAWDGPGPESYFVGVCGSLAD